MIKLENVSKYYHNEGVVTLGLRKINLEFNIGEFVAITGESGSGKSTLVNVISGIDTYEDGEIYINNEETSHFDYNDWENYRRDSIGFIFQNYSLIESYSVLKNVEVALIIQGIDYKTRILRAKEIIDKVGLTSHLHHKASKLSGGQKQRLAIARALAKDTPIIVADEPTGNLDSESSKQIFKLLNEVAKDRLVLMVTHNYEAAASYVTRKIRLFDGEIVEDKAIKKVETKEVIQKEKFYMSKFLKALLISLNNLLSQPKKTILLYLVTFVTVTFVVLAFGVYLLINAPQDYYSYYNVYPERLIIARQDKEPLTEDDYNDILNTSKVNSVIKADLVVDVSINSYIQLKHGNIYSNGYFNFSTINSTNIVGRLPEADNEIFISFYLDREDVNELTELVNHALKPKLEVYFNYSRSYHVKEFTLVGFEISNTRRAKYTVTEEALANLYEEVKIVYKEYPIVVSNNLGNFNIYYSGAIIVDDNLNGNQVKLNKYMFEGFDLNTSIVKLGNLEVDVELVDHNKDQWYDGSIYVSQEIYDQLKDPFDYQYTVIIDDHPNYQDVIKRLYDMGYNAYSPYYSRGQNPDAFFQMLNKVSSTIFYMVCLAIIYIISYLIIRTIMFSKKRDYMILRTIGLEQKNIRNVSRYEIFIVFGLAYIMFFIVYILLGIYIPHIFGEIQKMYQFKDYALLTFINIVLALLISRKFNNLLFKRSIYMNLRVEGE